MAGKGKKKEVLDEADEPSQEYLDAKAAHLKQHTRPLSGYLTKKYASISSAVAGSEMDYQSVKKIAETNESASMKIFMDKMKEATNGI